MGTHFFSASETVGLIRAARRSTQIRILSIFCICNTRLLCLAISLITAANLLSTTKLDPPDSPLAVNFQPRNKDAQQTCNNKVTDCSPDIQPTALVLDHIEETQCHDITDSHDHH